MLQIERDESAPSMAYIVIEEHFEDFAHRRWEKIAKDYQISVSEIQKISDYIQLLTPNPRLGMEKFFRKRYIRTLLSK